MDILRQQTFSHSGDAVTPTTPLPQAGDSIHNLLAKIPRGLAIPQASEIVVTYIGATNNVETVVYKDAIGTTLATLKLTYAAAGAANDDLVTGAALS